MGNPIPQFVRSCSPLSLCVLIIVLQFHGLKAQQSYVNNKQLNCQQNSSTALGYVCNGATKCSSYVSFRSTPIYNTPANIGYLLNADPSEISSLNNISDVAVISPDTIILVPVNCSCSDTFYRHTAKYTLQTELETYFSVANNTYEGLTTCQTLMMENPYNYRNLEMGMRLNVPLRCACPTRNQTAAGVRYLASYLITWRDTVEQIGAAFGGVDSASIYSSNELGPDDLVFPFTPILVPLKAKPTSLSFDFSASPPPSALPPPQLSAVPVGGGNSSRKWVFIGVGIGGGILLLVLLTAFLSCFLRRRSRRVPLPPKPKKVVRSPNYAAIENNSWSVSAEGVRYAIGSLTVYQFEDLEKATGFFEEKNRIKGSVYKGCFKGDYAAVKMMKGDVSGEIKVLKQINHSNIIRLSGFCVHEGNTYLVYEYAEKGSLSDWLHLEKYQDSSSGLGWRQRVQIAYDIADALNYLHNYTNPPYIHKNLKSSNVLLDGNMRAKVANFGLARAVENGEDGGLQMTRHVVGTHGYMAPEYIENGLITPKLDVFALGVVILELLSGREAAGSEKKNGGEKELLSAAMMEVLGGDNVREKLRGFIDPSLGHEYPLDLAYSMSQLARNCVARDHNSRPNVAEVFLNLSKILSSSLDWDPSDELEHSRSLSHGR